MADRIYKEHFSDLLQKIPDLSPKERMHVEREFSGILANGLTAFEVKEKIGSLQYRQTPKFGSEAYLERHELEAVKRKILGAMEKQ